MVSPKAPSSTLTTKRRALTPVQKVPVFSPVQKGPVIALVQKAPVYTPQKEKLLKDLENIPSYVEVIDT